MQGDPKVDELMRPVMIAIKRHVKDRDVFTDIYNRAYEAIMNSMDVNIERAEKAEAKVVELRDELERTSEAGLKDARLAVHLYTENQELKSSLSALREQTRWRKYPEEKPEEGEFVITVDEFGCADRKYLSKDDNGLLTWFNIVGWPYHVDSVIAWRPIDLPDEGER